MNEWSEYFGRFGIKQNCFGDVYMFDGISFVSSYVQLMHDLKFIPSVELKLLDHAHGNSN